MILILSDKIEVVLGAAGDLECAAFYSDRTGTTFAKSRKFTDVNTTSPTDISGSPASGYERQILGLSIFNKDVVNADVTVRINYTGSFITLYRSTLAPGEKIQYTEDTGFCTIANSGAIKTSQNPGTNPIGQTLQAVVLGADVINSNAVANTMMDVTGLSIPLQGSYHIYFKFIIRYSAALTTTGSRWGLTASAAASFLSFTSEYTLTATTTTRNASVQAYDMPAASNASSVLVNNLCIMEGIIQPTVDCILIARFASEVANSAITAKRGSLLLWYPTTY